jgi:hypothetical protein
MLRRMSPAPFCPAFLKLNLERALLRCHDPRVAQAAERSTQFDQLSVRQFRDLSTELLNVELLKADHGSLATRDSMGRSEAGTVV